jgi:peroxiredoxin Q/BCP
MELKKGQSAPDFKLSDDQGKEHKLRDYKGKTVVLYFYPADDTPGCTLEACTFRDDYLQYKAKGAVILGVSPQDERSHTKFKEKYSLPFPLLVDADHKVAEKYGAWGEKNMYGRKYMGIIRSTFVIDPQGKIAEAIYKVKVKGHSEALLESLDAMQA